MQKKLPVRIGRNLHVPNLTYSFHRTKRHAYEPHMTANALLWPQEAANIAGVSTEWLRQLAERGSLSVIRMGPRGVRLYERGEIERLALSRNSTAGGDTNELPTA
jgi:hypothetical protein